MPSDRGGAGVPLGAVQARAGELQAAIDAAADEATAREAADELHALLDGVENVDELPVRARPRADRADRAVRTLRRAVRGRRLSRRQAATLDRLLSVVANEDAALLVRDAWPVLVGGRLPDLAEQVPVSRERQAGHPAWCSQGFGGGCGRPSRAADGTVEWEHAPGWTSSGNWTAAPTCSSYGWTLCARPTAATT